MDGGGTSVFLRTQSDVDVLDELPRVLDALLAQARGHDDPTVHGVFLYAGDHATMPHRAEAHVTMLQSADHEHWVVFVDDRPPHTDADGVHRCPTPLHGDGGHDGADTTAFCHRKFATTPDGTRDALRTALLVARPAEQRPFSVFLARFNAAKAHGAPPSSPPSPDIIMRHTVQSEALPPRGALLHAQRATMVDDKTRPPSNNAATPSAPTGDTVQEEQQQQHQQQQYQQQQQQHWVHIGIAGLVALGAATVVGALAWSYATRRRNDRNSSSSASGSNDERRNKRDEPSASRSRSADNSA